MRGSRSVKNRTEDVDCVLKAVDVRPYHWANDIGEDEDGERCGVVRQKQLARFLFHEGEEIALR